MVAEILSQDEIDSLLTAISTGDVESGDQPAVSGAPAPAAEDTGVGGLAAASKRKKKTDDRHRKIKLYDFKRPDKFSKDQIRTLQMVHEVFARLNTASLSAMLRTMVHVHVASVDQLTYEEFLKSIPNPTSISVINMNPLHGSSVLEMDPSIAFSLIDRLFGGKGSTETVSREMTEIEISVMERVVEKFLNNLTESWVNIVDLKPKLEKIESNPQFVQIVPPNDMVVLITLETKVGEIEGMTNFCIPYLVLEPVIHKLSAQYWYAAVRKGSTRESLHRIKDKLNDIKVDVAVEVGRTEISVDELIGLEKGDVIKLDTNHRDDMRLLIDWYPKFKCKAGVYDNKFSTKITGEIEFVQILEKANMLKHEPKSKEE